MKIALISDTYTPDINGVATSTRILRNALVKKGHHVLIVTTELPQDSTYIDPVDENIVRIPGIELQGNYSYRASNIYSFKAMRELKSQGIEIIHSQTEFGLGIFSRIAAELLEIPVIYTYHTMWADYSHYINPFNSKTVEGVLKKAIYRLSKVYGNHCNEIIVPSQKTKQALLEYGLKKEIHVIATGLELDKFNQYNQDDAMIKILKEKYDLHDQFVITYVGRIAKEKNITEIIEAIELLKKEHQFKFLVVGSGPSLDHLMQLCHEKQLDDYVVFVGAVDSDDVPSYYHISDIFVSASLSETQGLTFIEAMASSVPVLARYDQNLEGVIVDGENGFFFQNRDSLVQRLNELMTIDLTKMKQHACQHAKQYSSEQFYHEVFKVYQKAVSTTQTNFVIKKIEDFNDQQCIITLHQGEKKYEVTVSSNSIELYQLEIDLMISRELYIILRDEQIISKAYKKALKFLSYRDYTINQMRQKLQDNEQLDDDQLEKVINLLIDKKLLNDHEYAITYLKRCIRHGIGINKAVVTLIKYQVSSEIIDEAIEVLEDDEEYEAALEMIEKAVEKSSAFSYRQMILKIRNKLHMKGFTKDTIERAIEDYEFEYSPEREMQALEVDYDKALVKYRRRVSNIMLRDKIINNLLKKGYSYDSIKQVILEKGDFNDD